MQPLKISIQGDYIDSQIYSGRLFLWKMDGALSVYSWYKIIEIVNNGIKEKIILNNAFLDNDFLYKSGIHNIFIDNDFKDLYLKKYNSIKNRNISLTLKEIESCLLGEQDFPSNEMPIDTEIYSNKLYYSIDSGLFSTGASGRTKFPVSTKPKKIWDCVLHSIKANRYPQIALSAGNEGLFELSISDRSIYTQNEVENHIFKISENKSIFANYAYLSVINSSNQDADIALFKWDENHDLNRVHKYYRKFDSNINLEISDKSEFTWGVDDKIYTIKNDKIIIRKFRNILKNEDDEHILDFANSEIPDTGSNVINGGTSFFGTMIEYENKLIVLQSDNEVFSINDTITRWRVFNRSKNYQNQLHVIHDDRIDIYSFHNDYFLDQYEKIYGVQYHFERADLPKFTLSKNPV